MRPPSVLLLMLAIARTVAAPVPVTVDVELGMRRAGEPYFIKGAGGEKQLDRLAARGANSIRTWDTENLASILGWRAVAQGRGDRQLQGAPPLLPSSARCAK